MSTVKIFLSHTSEFVNIARSLKWSILALASPDSVEVKLSEEMQGGANWRVWIEQNTRETDAFVFLYPRADIDNGWPAYELARFTENCEKPVIWIRNLELQKLPGMFEQYQSYPATEEGILKFFSEVFAKGLFTHGEPLNAEVDDIGSKSHKSAVDAACELAEAFADTLIKPKYYTRRILISLAYDRNRKFDPEQSKVTGNEDGMKMLGMSADATLSWSAVSEMFGDQVEWPRELETEFASIVAGALPPHLSPFATEQGIFIPIIAKCEVAQSQLRRVAVLFVEANSQKLRPMFEWQMPTAMPGQLASFVQLVRLMLRVRYDILDPKYQETRFQSPSQEMCLSLCDAALTEYKTVREESRKIGISGVSAFQMLFDKSLWDKLDAAADEYATHTKALKAYPEKLKTAEADFDHAAALAHVLQGLRENNAHWLAAAAAQFALFEWR
ncbi:TIR domain-containing protein [Paraburkholderia sp. UYCP14C]|uniref:TIR domain-containing protein n=1 Tax=Paraburkholderia sp. UYCP14C TaxID=2511130 RepID=UPI001020A7EC|nr:TIR domain-containing protein [Paraburkholderia sp. UYCP14C]RZF27130.1 TIR domain-containing protein [Paraburkholderia sp. UYCP14C]